MALVFTRVNPNVLSRGLGGFTLRTYVRPLNGLWRWMKLESVRTQRDPNIVIPFVRVFGAETWQNFRQERWPGASYESGKEWAPLKRWTAMEREARGYGKWRPVMRQSGQLADMSSTPYRNWRWGQRSIRGKNATTPYGEHTSLTSTATINNGEFNASISGERVANQAAYFISRKDGSRAGVPPRPFWGLTTSMIERAVPSSLEQFNKSWASRKPGTIR